MSSESYMTLRVDEGIYIYISRIWTEKWLLCKNLRLFSHLKTLIFQLEVSYAKGGLLDKFGFFSLEH